MTDLNALEADVKVLILEVWALRTALRPFADHAPFYANLAPETPVLVSGSLIRVRAGDFRRAADVLGVGVGEDRPAL